MDRTVPDQFCKRLEATEETPNTKVRKPKATKDSKKTGQVVNFKKIERSRKHKEKSKYYFMMHGPNDSVSH